MFSHDRPRSCGRPTMAIIAAGATGLVVAGIACAAPAYADPDTQYINTLASDSIAPINGNTAGMVSNAHAICHNLAAGESYSGVSADLYQVESQPPGPLTRQQTDFEMSTAVRTYCPQYNQ